MWQAILNAIILCSVRTVSIFCCLKNYFSYIFEIMIQKSSNFLQTRSNGYWFQSLIITCTTQLASKSLSGVHTSKRWRWQPKPESIRKCNKILRFQLCRIVCRQWKGNQISCTFGKSWALLSTHVKWLFADCIEANTSRYQGDLEAKLFAYLNLINFSGTKRYRVLGIDEGAEDDRWGKNLFTKGLSCLLR